MSVPKAVDSHYSKGAILDSIRHALVSLGKDPETLSVADLAPVDEFHIRGREATIELANRAALEAGSRVIDVGCGLGGSARYLASQHGCSVVGVDLTTEYVDTAQELTRWVGLDDRVEFHCASALAMPFADDTFDVAWTEHVQMNIEDKAAFYGEIARILKPGGALLFHDIFEGPAGDLHYPVPWADSQAISFLAQPDAVRSHLEASDLEVATWLDTTQPSIEWFTGALERLAAAGPPPIGIHLLMGESAPRKLQNIARNLREHRIEVVQAMATKRTV